MTKKMKTDITNVLGAIMSATEQESDQVFAAIADQPEIVRACELIVKCRPDEFAIVVGYQFNKVLGALVRSVLKPSSPEEKARMELAEFLFLRAREIEVHYKRIIVKFEGGECSSDKSRTIMRSLAVFFITGKPIKFNYSGEYTYQIPKRVFTTHDGIIEFFYGLREFHYGYPDRYLKALASAMNPAAEQEG